VDVNLLYLQSLISVNGRSALQGRNLYDAFRRRFTEVHLAYSVAPDEEIPTIHQRIRADFFAASDLDAVGINWLYLEGGLFVERGRWKVEEALVRGFVDGGGLLIVADVDATAASDFKANYGAVADLLGSRVAYDWPDRSAGQPLYGSDETRAYHSHRSFRCLPEKMVVSEWLRPVYQDVASVAVSLPAVLHTFSDILASGNADTSGTLVNDIWYDKKNPFAAAHRYGAGYVVFIAAGVSHDLISEHGDNGPVAGEHCRPPARGRRGRRRPATPAAGLAGRAVPQSQVLSHRGVRARGGRGAQGPRHPALARPGPARRRRLADRFDRRRSRHHDRVRPVLERGRLGAPWVGRELAAATSLLVEREIPIYVVTLDATPVPASISDLLRVDGSGRDAATVVREIGRAVDRRRAGTRSMGYGTSPKSAGPGEDGG
jgi:hypothetical protein